MKNDSIWRHLALDYQMYLPRVIAKSTTRVLSSMFLLPIDQQARSRGLVVVRGSWRQLHDSDWAKTLFVTSRIMDRVAPPRLVLLWGVITDVLDGTLGKRLGPAARQRLESTLKDSDLEWLRRPAALAEVPERSDVPTEEVDRVVRAVVARMAHVNLGVCLRLDSKTTAFLQRLFPHAGLMSGERVCLVDSQRLCSTARQILRRGEANNPYLLAGALGWAVWSHEQSHATRPECDRLEEEVMAQVEALRFLIACPIACLHPIRPLPDGQEVIRRLARRQPSPYRVVLDKDFLRSVGVATT